MNALSVMADKAIPHAEGIDFSFPPISCQLFSSKLTCLVGPYRSQLRAYLLMLAGVYRPAAGHVEIFGQSISELDQLHWRKIRCQIGYFSGTAPLELAQNALMNVMMPALYHANLPFQATACKARALLTEFMCDFEFIASTAQLDSFQKAQVALARALVLDPDLLILDVPFNDLGAREREKMGKLLGCYQRDRAVCMIGGLQYPHFLAGYASQIIFISEYKIIYFDGWADFIKSEDAEVHELLSLL